MASPASYKHPVPRASVTSSWTAAEQNARLDDLRSRKAPDAKSGGSQKWEPAHSAALRLATTVPYCPSRSEAPCPTSSDPGRLSHFGPFFPDTEEVAGSNPVRPTRQFTKSGPRKAGCLALRVVGPFARDRRGLRSSGAFRWLGGFPAWNASAWIIVGDPRGSWRGRYRSRSATRSAVPAWC